MSDSDVLQSAVRVPTPPPGASYSPTAASRKRSPPSRSPSPNRRRSPPGDSLREGPDAPKVDVEHADDRERQLAERFREHEKREAARKPMTEEQKQASAKAEYEKLLNMRSGGTYIPPARLRALQAQITDKTSKEYQRMAWEALKKSINGLINKVNVSNIKFIVPELFAENLVRGRGLFCRSIMKAQAASLPFTPIYAAMAAIVNTKLPQVGDLLLTRLVIQFRKAFKRNDKAVCISSTTFIAHLCNQQVAHEMLAAQILLLLLHKPTDDSVEIAVGLTREVGQHLEEMNAPIALAVFDQFRNILHEADIDKRVQYMIEVLFQVRKDRYKDNPAIKEELDLVEEEDQITHRAGLDDELETQDTLNIFKYDPEWEEHEEAYRKLKAEILGEESDEDNEEGSDESEEEESDTEEVQMDIKDQSNTDLVNLRRTIYLTIMSSIDFEECCHKLMKINLPAGLEHELPSMIIECCSQERTYSKFYGLIGERFAKINRLWSDLFEAAFAKYYDTIHRYETNKLRNIAQFFGHLISNDAIGWHVLSVVHLNEEETTSSSRIFIKILFQNLAENLGLPGLQARFRDDILRPSFEGLFPTDNPRHTRFSVNYFTSIGMGCPLWLHEPLDPHHAPHLIDPVRCAQHALDLLTPVVPDLLRTPALLLGTAAAPTLAPSLPLPGAEATHLRALAPQFAAVVTHQSVGPGPPQDDPDPDPDPDLSPAHRPSVVEHVPAPMTREAQVAVPIDLVAQLFGLSHRRAEAKALLAGGTAATPDQFHGLSHLRLVGSPRPEVRRRKVRSDIHLNLCRLLPADVRLLTLSLVLARLLLSVGQSHGVEAIHGHHPGADKSRASDPLILTSWRLAERSVCYCR
ncbi:MIF4-like type 1/2/3 [Penicillium vulpinum]|uniref:MIF4-like type 1/2/3 n=1 Tax=Penicillium vulpinum TaxID=29845 RepID=UPI002546A98F|nr:MIF4-like type 1/2/3 [Penicillium vulpinum]KAJ5964919.1 MIF4-like type 1/2/3 [Penicillium vulpinum]